MRMRHPTPAARAIRNNPAPTTTAPMGSRDAPTGWCETFDGRVSNDGSYKCDGISLAAAPRVCCVRVLYGIEQTGWWKLNTVWVWPLRPAGSLPFDPPAYVWEIVVMLGPHSPRQNHLLAALPAPERERLYPHLELGPLPQEFIANMLGVRREGVAQVAGKLQSAGLIHYNRGRITVLDRPRLEAWACECYQVVKSQFDRLLPYA